jgi:hypothetical protein
MAIGGDTIIAIVLVLVSDRSKLERQLLHLLNGDRVGDRYLKCDRSGFE